MIKRMDSKYGTYTDGVIDVREEIVKMIEKYEKENYEDSEYYFGFVDGVDSAIKWIDGLMDKRWQEYRTAEPGSPFGPSIDW